MSKKSTAILLLNLGGPDSLKAIRPFLVNLFSDRRIIKLPVQPLMARIIASSRSKKIMPRYEAIGGASPINKLTREQAEALKETLNREQPEGNYEVFVGMRYWHPLIDEVMNNIIHSKRKFDKLIVLPLFPQYSCTTTGSAFEELKKFIKGEKKWHSEKINVKYINNWHDNPLYIDALAKKIEEGFAQLAGVKKSDIHIVFSAHSIPKKFVDEGDPYQIQIEETVKDVLAKIDIPNYTIAYQSRSGPVEWLEPNTEDALKELAANGQTILVVPISFVSDHIETLYEIDIMYAQMCKSLGAKAFVRAPSLNADPLFIESLADIVKKNLE